MVQTYEKNVLCMINRDKTISVFIFYFKDSKDIVFIGHSMDLIQI